MKTKILADFQICISVPLNTENVINRSCFNKEPFELYFNQVFYTENSNKINEIKDDVILVLKKTL